MKNITFENCLADVLKPLLRSGNNCEVNIV